MTEAEKPPLPIPLRDWVLVRKDKKGGSLILPDSAQAAFEFYVEAAGPEAEGIEVDDRLELRPNFIKANAVIIDDDHALVPAGGVVGVYR
jgi:hypothetical protein